MIAAKPTQEKTMKTVYCLYRVSTKGQVDKNDILHKGIYVYKTFSVLGRYSVGAQPFCSFSNICSR